ncbi:hypothetical protein L1887_42421 [Cichorium endivia]|nr:hypothetical protein L1887_42421 [Cichorium endivia]
MYFLLLDLFSSIYLYITLPTPLHTLSPPDSSKSCVKVGFYSGILLLFSYPFFVCLIHGGLRFLFPLGFALLLVQ